MMIAQPDIVKVDKPYRRQLFAWYLLAIAIGFAFFKFIVPAGLDAFSHVRSPAYFVIAEVSVVIFLLLFVIPAMVLITIGRKTLRSERFPYPGMKVIRDTVVVTGRNARFRGKALVILGYVSIGMAVVGSIAMHLLFMYIRSSPILSHLPLF